jgi:acylphosphatase
MKRCRLTISGRVQGVWYRQSALEQAQLLGLSGWVLNLPDGRIEALVEGTEENVAELIKWCRKGPPSAIVKSVQINQEPHIGDLPRFYIKK